MIKRVINEEYDKTNQEQFNQLCIAFANQSKNVQIVVQKLISEIIYLQGILEDSRKRLDKSINSSYHNENAKDDFDFYIKSLDKYSDIIKQLIDILKK